MWAMQSRESVLEHEKFKEIFASYAEAIGIDKPQEIEAWTALSAKIKKIETDKLKAEQEKQARLAREAEEKAIKEKEDQIRYLRDNHAIIVNNFFKALKNKNLTRLVGQPKRRPMIVA